MKLCDELEAKINQATRQQTTLLKSIIAQI